MSPSPISRKLYHIVHVDRLPSIVADGRLLCDAEMAQRTGTGTIIGMSEIKARRLVLPVKSHQGLNVGACVPFYFCPRSVMLYLIYQGNHPELAYKGGQDPIVHLELDLHRVVKWAEDRKLRWAFTLSNAGSYYFEDRCDLKNLHEVNWQAVNAAQWSGTFKEGKQAEFLVEQQVAWDLVVRIGVLSRGIGQRTGAAIARASHQPEIEIKRNWYY
ncbi:MAG: DUF4433 domain-containing protein [Terracidiphilus sp.]